MVTENLCENGKCVDMPTSYEAKKRHAVDALFSATNDNMSVPMGLIAPVDAVMRILGFDVMF